ncbi:threonine/serine exporter family protein [Marinilabiliaceae bacterium JC040]|nr:threonine/serine exporter family protein [Marinilabiliaceae bacterium JC040]
MKRHVPQQYKFVIKLGMALHKYGILSYKIESYLRQICEIKNIKGTFMDNPTWINYVFYEDDDQTYTYMKIVKPGEINLGGLARIHEITKKLLAEEISFSEASDEIENIDNNTQQRKILEFIAFLISGPSFCVILNTNWMSAIAAGIAGIFIYLLYNFASKSDYISSTLESAVAFASTLVVGGLSYIFPNINVSLSILASIIIFIPGLSITNSLEEITSYNLTSGTAKFSGAMVSLFKQFFGVMLGLAFISLFMEVKHVPTIDDIPKWVDPIAILLLVCSLLPIFKVRHRDVFLCIVIGFISFYTTVFLEFTGILLSIFIGTIAVMICSKIFGKISKSPKIVFIMPGIVMLVPGSKAFIGLSSLFGTSAADTPSNMWMQVAYIFMGIIGGLLLSGSFMSTKNHVK